MSHNDNMQTYKDMARDWLSSQDVVGDLVLDDLTDEQYEVLVLRTAYEIKAEDPYPNGLPGEQESADGYTYGFSYGKE